MYCFANFHLVLRNIALCQNIVIKMIMINRIVLTTLKYGYYDMNNSRNGCKILPLLSSRQWHPPPLPGLVVLVIWLNDNTTYQQNKKKSERKKKISDPIPTRAILIYHRKVGNWNYRPWSTSNLQVDDKHNITQIQTLTDMRCTCLYRPPVILTGARHRLVQSFGILT